MKAFSWFFVILLALLPSIARRADGHDLETIRSAWKSYAELPEASHSRIIHRTSDGSSEIVRSSLERWLTEEGSVYETHLESANEYLGSFAEGQNARYRFRVEKAKTDAPWTLRDVTVTSKGDVETSSIAEEAPLLNLANAGRADELLSLPELAVKSLTQYQDSVVLTLGNSGSSSNANARVASAVLTLDPSAMYVVKKATIYGSATANFDKIEIEHEWNVVDGVPIVKRKDVVVQEEDLTTHVSSETELWEMTPEPPRSHFTLTRFGLPEPPELRTAGSYRTPPWLFYFVGGVLCVAVGAFAVHRALKGRARA